MEIRKAEFLISSPATDRCPKNDRIEYTFVGRSSVRKSSFINMLRNHKGLSKVSSTPGKTLLINHFLINDEWYLVDLPGYGFTKKSKKVQADIEEMINTYILQREQLVNLFVLIDVRHKQQKIDHASIDWLGENEVPFTIVFTKASRPGTVKAKANAAQWIERSRGAWEELPPYFITSSEKRTGHEELLVYIDGINQSLL